MKTPRFLSFTAAFLFLCTILCAAEAPKLETLLGEYKKARTDVLTKLNQSYAGQADELAKQYQAIPNLDAADRARTFAKNLRGPEDSTDLRMMSPSNTSNDPLATLEANYAQARQVNLLTVYTFYTTAATNLRNELVKGKDKDGAAVCTAFLEKIKADAPTPAPHTTPVKKKKAPAK
ncbi:MAG TPA: hypothetical protein VK961_19875 [Chthoniobacter sp.]|nr:hypothetical protein [Chthoniobacter sp.]